MYDERDTRSTLVRRRIRALYEDRSIVPSRDRLGCSSLPICSQSVRRGLYTGNWAFVGCDYGKARIAESNVKVLFVAMDRGGHGKAQCEKFEDTQKCFRSSIEVPKNPHMGGVSLILQHLLDEKDVVKISGQCAFTNAVKCTQRTHQAKTHATRRMITECAQHLWAELKVLKPDLIITQGRHPTKTVLSYFSNVKAAGKYAGDQTPCPYLASRY